MDALERELKSEREATQQAFRLSADIVKGHQNQQQQINALSGQVEALATALPRLTEHCQSLSVALTSLDEQSAQIVAELDRSRKR